MTKILLTLAHTSEKTRRSINAFIDSLENMFKILSQPGHTKPSYTLALYAGLYLIFATVATLPLLFLGKGAVVMAINELHSPWLDFFFRYATHLGDGVLFALVAVGIVIWKRRYWLAFAIAGIGHAALVQLGKRVIFPDSPRPMGYFSEDVLLHLVEGVKVHTQHSFPSGHTATGFALAAIIS